MNTPANKSNADQSNRSGELPGAGGGVVLEPVRASDFEALSLICHEAFDALHQRHNVSRDVSTLDVGKLIVGGVMQRPDYVGVVAKIDGEPVGLNYVLLADGVCGLGPIAVKPGIQSKGVGKRLMQWGIDEVRARRGADVNIRLFQEAINTASLSLYTSVGFHWRDAAAMMLPKPQACADGSCRLMTPDDLDAVEALCVSGHGGSRRNDVLQLVNTLGLPAFVRQREGRVVAYHIATLFGHGAAETQDDLLTLVQHLASQVEESMSVVLVPLSQEGLFADALKRGFATRKVVNEMSLVPETAATGPCLPSIQG